MKAYFQEKDKYSDRVQEIGFVPERNNRYAYFLNATGTLSSRKLAVETYTAGGVDTGIGVDEFKAYTAITYLASVCTGAENNAAGSWLDSGAAPALQYTVLARGNVDS